VTSGSPLPNTPSTTDTVELAPNYALSTALVVLGLPFFIASPWIGGAIAIFGLFLLFQTVSLRLVFTPTALEVYRSEKQIRSFPYAEWQNWEIYVGNLPVLFYFKEVNSIHFLPIIFDPQQLRTCLEQRCPKQS
jgi:hypothetical protein